MGHGASTHNRHSQGSARNTSGHSFSTNSRRVPVPILGPLCSGCGMKFHQILRRSNSCFYCGESYCKACLDSESNKCVCRRCVVFVVSGFEWNTLMGLSAKDLIWFLHRNRIPSSGFTEKEQMVEAIMDLYGNEAYQLTRQTQTQRVCELKLQMEGLRGEENLSRSVVDDIDHALASANESSSPHNILPRRSSTRLPNATMPSTSGRNSPPLTVIDVENEENSSPPANIPPRTPSGTMPSPSEVYSAGVTSIAPTVAPQRVTLDDIVNEEALQQLSVKQLKDLLASNFVDFRGCLERHELLRRASLLYTAHVEHKRLADYQNQLLMESLEKNSQTVSKPVNTANILSRIEENTCRICMDAMIDCVFLECGHSVTCVVCGKKMAECPICRQYIVRVVHIFRS